MIGSLLRLAPVLVASMLLVSMLLVSMLLASCGNDRAPPSPDGGPYDQAGRHRDGPAAPGASRPNFVVIVIDALRADAVGLPGRPEVGQMPYVSQLAESGVSFSNACAPAPWTVPSVTSLLTGLLPSRHGCDASLRPARLVDAVTTFAEVLHATYGYETAAFMAGPWFGGEQSLLQGFETRRHPYALRGTKQLLESFAAGRRPGKPFLLLLHSFEAHDPYGASNHPFPPRAGDVTPARRAELESMEAPWRIARAVLTSRDDRRALQEIHGPALGRRVVRYVQDGYGRAPRADLAGELREAYRSGVAAVDGYVRETVEQLRAFGLMENTLLVVTSDHGEAFGEHGTLVHGGQLYDELVHIPLVMSGPAPFRGGRVLDGGVGLVDVMPTLLAFAGADALPDVEGRSFLAQVRAGSSQGRPVVSEALRDRDSTGTDTRQSLIAVRSERWKYVITYDELAGTVTETAFDLRADPGELYDLCQGKGRIDGLTFDAAFCRAVERARDRIGGAARMSNDLYATPYGGGRAQVWSERPKPCDGGTR